jgi:hypothetical protein
MQGNFKTKLAMEIKAETDREIIIQMDGKINNLSENLEDFKVTFKDSIEDLVTALKDLETRRISEIEIRVANLEKWKSEFSGGYKLVAGIILLMGAIATYFQIKGK